MWKRGLGLIGAAMIFGVAATEPAPAATACRNTGSFDRWLADFKREAASQGISRQVIAAAFDGVTFDPAVVRRDRGQGVFAQGFLQFAARMTGGGRHPNGIRQMKANERLFAAIEKRFGVPPPVVAAIWGLESDYGAYKGSNYNIIRAVATLAYDCRRPDFFRPQLMDALRIVQRGDLRVDEMIGNWAGELGPTQFTPSDYFKHGVDLDGDGRVDMIRSVPDALASAANLIRSYGWQRGQPWLQEVRVPSQMAWQEADLAIQHPVSQWARWGVRAAHGRLPADSMPASLVLPMGRNGPAFLAYPNFNAFTEWNAAFVYATTVAYFATRLAGAPPVGKGNGPVDVPDVNRIRELQGLLINRGFLDDVVDGRMGSKTRAAVKQAQLKYRLPADSYPTPDLIDRLRTGR